ncbi:MAG: hypothetical protein D6729_02755 [Deltaproteobacteria bacterium]|nr:MAG: hypothetical protein D6729_02755 [Deltaproteobacteria bacterium]
MRPVPFRCVIPPALFPWVLSLALAACGGPAAPCSEHCLDVAGRYFFDFAATDPDTSSCQELYYTGFQDELTLTQDGSKLTLSLLDGLPGVLREDDSADFDPFPGQTEAGEPGTVTFKLRFLGTPGSLRAEGSLTFLRTRDKCVATAPVQGQQLSSG